MIRIFIIFLLQCSVVTCHDVFDKETWRQAGEYLNQHMDRQCKPCEAIYEYVCGNFGANLTNTTEGRTTDQDQTDHMIGRILEAIKTIDADDDGVPEYKKKVREFYDECVENRDRSDDADTRDSTLEKVMEELRQEQNPFRLLGQIHRLVGAHDENPLPIVFAMKDARRGSRFALSTGKMVDVVEDDDDVQSVSFADLAHLVPSFDWVAYFDGFVPTELREEFDALKGKKIVDLDEPKAMEKLAKELKDKVEGMLETLEDLLGDEFIYGSRSTDETVEYACVADATKVLPGAVARIYFDYIEEDIIAWRRDIATLTRNIISAFRFLLNSAVWLDAHDKEKVQWKIDDIRSFPGIPDWINNDTAVMRSIAGVRYVEEMNIYENILQWRRNEQDRMLEMIVRSPVMERQPTFEINAYYHPGSNRLVAQLGMFTAPQYHVKYPLALKYGGYGFFIGHELMHAFDTIGAHTGGPHWRKKTWLSKSAVAQFKERQACLEKQYSTYCLPDKSECVDGTLTAGENMADVDGLKIAYTAYKFAAMVHGEDPAVPNFKNFTLEQLFFVANVRTMCSKGVGDFKDAHTPDKPRVDVMLKNVPVFARAFGCAAGSTYLPFERCSVWGDLANPAKMRK